MNKVQKDYSEKVIHSARLGDATQIKMKLKRNEKME